MADHLSAKGHSSRLDSRAALRRVSRSSPPSQTCGGSHALRACERQHAWRIEAKASRIEVIRLAKEKAEQEERDRQERLRRERIENLLSLADEHHKAQTIRALVESAMAGSKDKNVHLEWEEWALNVAAELDPVTGGRIWGEHL